MTTDTLTDETEPTFPKTAGRRWYVVLDEAPCNPRRPLTAVEAASLWLQQVIENPDEAVEIRQCDEDDMEWAEVDDFDLSTHDVCDGAGNLALPVAGAALWNANRPHLGWACPPSLHFEPNIDEDESGEDWTDA